MSTPQECPKSPPRLDGGPPYPCALGDVETGSDIIKMMVQCSRCGWVDPRSLDRWAEHWYKTRISQQAKRTALAASGEPFTFVRTAEADVSLDEALGQALAAASMCWEHPEAAGVFNDIKAKRIFEQLKLLLQEKSREDRRNLVEQIVINTH